MRSLVFFLLMLVGKTDVAQVRWQNVDSLYGPLPRDFHVFKTTDSLDGRPFVAYYAIAKLKSKLLNFSVDTTLRRRLTPNAFFKKSGQPLLLVNTSFFSFSTHQNLTAVIRSGKLVGFNLHAIPLTGKDTLRYRHPLGSALGIRRNRTADVAWLFTDSSKRFAFASQVPTPATTDSVNDYDLKMADAAHGLLKKWKMRLAVGGGPVLVQDGEIKITNNEELKFSGKAIDDLHPRTLMGYTKNAQIIIMVIQGRMPGIAEGATLTQEARLMKALGCVEALNLDGGGSSCMLINGRQTITPSSKGEQRPIPAVFLIKATNR